MAASSKDFISLVSIAAWEILEEETGITVDQRFADEGATAIQAIVTDAADVATNVGVAVGVPAALGGAKIVDVVGTQRATWAFAARPEFTSFEQLDGARIAVHGETSFTAAVTQYFADQYDFEYELMIIPGSEVRAEALARGEIDGTVIDLPDVISLEDTYPGKFHVLRTIGEEFPELIEMDVWLSQAWIDAHPDLAVAVVKAHIQASRKLATDRDYAIALAKREFPEMAPAIVEDLVDTYQERGVWPDDGLITPDRAKETLTFLNSVGEIELGDEVTDEHIDTFFNFELVEKALEELESSS